MKIDLKYDPDQSLAVNLAAFAYAGFERLGRGAVVFFPDPASPLNYMALAGLEQVQGFSTVVDLVRAYDPKTEFIEVIATEEGFSFERHGVNDQDSGPQSALEQIRVSEFLNKRFGRKV